jgi:hypothetical protein
VTCVYILIWDPFVYIYYSLQEVTGMSRLNEFTTSLGNMVIILKKAFKRLCDIVLRDLVAVSGWFVGYWRKPVTIGVRSISMNISASGTKTKRIVIAAMLSAVAAIMQSAGALGGPGFIVSSLVTLPVAVAATISIATGAAAYSVTLLLLLILQPSEIVIFPFTTGMLGLGIGLALKLFKTRAAVTAFAALSLAFGISFLLYIFRFPILGPASLQKFNLSALALIYAFSYLYSWLWCEISMLVSGFLSRAVAKAS